MSLSGEISAMDPRAWRGIWRVDVRSADRRLGVERRRNQSPVPMWAEVNDLPADVGAPEGVVGFQLLARADPAIAGNAVLRYGGGEADVRTFS